MVADGSRKKGFFMKVKEYLRAIQRLDRMINQKIEHLYELKQRSACIGSFDYSKDRVQTSTPPDPPYVRITEQIADLNDEINTDIDRLVNMKARIEYMMRMCDLSPNQRVVIQGRYFQDYSWGDIAVILNCTVRNVHYIHQAALKSLGKHKMEWSDAG